MGSWFSDTRHRRICCQKRQEREHQIRRLSASHSSPLTPLEQKIHAYPIPELVSKCRAGEISTEDVLRVYIKKTLQAQKETNCITDILVEDALKRAASSSISDDTLTTSDGGIAETSHRPLLGVPVSLKDTIHIAGHDTTMGMSANVGRPVSQSCPMVHLLEDAGAIIIAKTTTPTALFAVDTESDLFGRTTNPYSREHGVGASTGGGAALVARGGSKIEIGSDVAGSLRLPAHACGVWALKASAGRFPVLGNVTSMMGLEALPTITGPIASSLEDLEEFLKRFMSMQPWEYDHTCLPIPWRPLQLHSSGKKLKWGIIWEDGVIPPAPACKRALTMVVESLRADGHEVTDFTPPSIPQLLEIGYQLIFADGGKQIKSSLLPSEPINAPLKATIDLVNLPRIVKKLLAEYYRSSDPIYSGLLDVMHPKTIVEERELVVRRDAFRLEWLERWKREQLDFILTVPFPFPALENGTAEKASMMSAGLSFVFNLLDFSAGVMPVTNVDPLTDSLPPNFVSTADYQKLNNIAKVAYTVYDARKMKGLPIGVQVVGRRFEEEKVIEGMKMVQAALDKSGQAFRGKLAQ